MAMISYYFHYNGPCIEYVTLLAYIFTLMGLEMVVLWHEDKSIPTQLLNFVKFRGVICKTSVN